MEHQIASTLTKIAIPAALIIVVLVIARLRRISRQDLGLFWPSARTVLLWIGIWILWIIAGEVVGKLIGAGKAVPWPAYSPLVIMLRIAAIGVIGPASEELVMRGMLYYRLYRTRLGAWGAVLVTAAAWALMHYHYDWKTILLIFGDGLFLGAARVRTRSVVPPILMHILGNLLSIVQSLQG